MELAEKQRRIAIDIDDVLSEFRAYFLYFFNERHGTRFTLRDITSYQYSKVLGISDEEVVEEMIDFYKSPFFRRIIPVPGSREAIKKLHKKNLLFIVTSRPDTLYGETLSWLDKYFPNIFLRLHFTNQFVGNGSKKNKSYFCLEQSYGVIIEDSAEYANECAERDIDSFILTRPWNEREILHPRVKRVENWEGILQHLNG